MTLTSVTHRLYMSPSRLSAHVLFCPGPALSWCLLRLLGLWSCCHILDNLRTLAGHLVGCPSVWVRLVSCDWTGLWVSGKKTTGGSLPPYSSHQVCYVGGTEMLPQFPLRGCLSLSTSHCSPCSGGQSPSPPMPGGICTCC